VGDTFSQHDMYLFFFLTFEEEVYHQAQFAALLVAYPLVPDLRGVGSAGFPGDLKHLPAL